MPLEHFVDQYNATAEMSSANNDAKVSKEARAVFEMLGQCFPNQTKPLRKEEKKGGGGPHRLNVALGEGAETVISPS